MRVVRRAVTAYKLGLLLTGQYCGEASKVMGTWMIILVEVVIRLDMLCVNDDARLLRQFEAMLFDTDLAHHRL